MRKVTNTIHQDQARRRAAEYLRWLEHNVIVTNDEYCLGWGTLAHQSRGLVIRKGNA